MAGLDLAVDVLKIGGTPHGQAIEVPGLDVMPVGLVETAGLLFHPRQSIMGLGESRAGAASHDRPPSRLRDPSLLPSLLDLRGMPHAGSGRFGRQERAIRGVIGVVTGRDHQHHLGPDPLAIRRDRLDPHPEIAESVAYSSACKPGRPPGVVTASAPAGLRARTSIVRSISRQTDETDWISPTTVTGSNGGGIVSW